GQAGALTSALTSLLLPCLNSPTTITLTAGSSSLARACARRTARSWRPADAARSPTSWMTSAIGWSDVSGSVGTSSPCLVVLPGVSRTGPSAACRRRDPRSPPCRRSTAHRPPDPTRRRRCRRSPDGRNPPTEGRRAHRRPRARRTARRRTAADPARQTWLLDPHRMIPESSGVPGRPPEDGRAGLHDFRGVSEVELVGVAERAAEVGVLHL